MFSLYVFIVCLFFHLYVFFVCFYCLFVLFFFCSLFCFDSKTFFCCVSFFLFLSQNKALKGNISIRVDSSF